MDFDLDSCTGMGEAKTFKFVSKTIVNNLNIQGTATSILLSIPLAHL